MQSVGPLGKIAEMIPGLGKAKIPDNALETQEKKLKGWKHAIKSMTKEEIEILNCSKSKPQELRELQRALEQVLEILNN